MYCSYYALYYVHVRKYKCCSGQNSQLVWCANFTSMLKQLFLHIAMFDSVSCNSSVEYIDDTKIPIVICTKPGLTAGHLEKSSSFDESEFPSAYTADDNNSIKDEEETKELDTTSSYTTLYNDQTT